MGCGLLFPGITCEVQKERQIFQKSPLSYSDHPDHSGNRAGVIVTYTMLHNYQNRAVAMLTETVGDQCDILCNLIIRENYLNDTDSEVVNSKSGTVSNVV